jgi:pimeloyl-ACP methyl ester carboxylesterase
MRTLLEQLLPDAVRFDAWKRYTRLDMPFFIFQGENDVLTPPSLAEIYLNDIVAPVRAMALIRNAGHFAAFLEPEQFLAELLSRECPLVVDSR